MAQKTIYADNATLYHDSSIVRDFDTSGLGTINWARLYYSSTKSGVSPGSGSSQSISGNWKSITFTYAGYDVASVTNIRLVVDYTSSAPPPEGGDPPPPADPACTAPTSVSISPSGATAYPGQTFTVSWGGATGPIYSYGLYISVNGADYKYAYQTGDTSTSYVVTAPAAGNTWYIKIKSLAAHYTNDSHVSAQTVQINSVVGTIPPPDSPTTSSAYYDAGATIRFSWGASTAGTNNSATGYQVRYATGDSGWSYAYVEGVLYFDVAAAGAGVAKHFSVMAYGERINSDWTETITVHSYPNPTAPTSVLVSPTTAFTGDSVTLYWGGANAGVGVGIQKYQYLLDGVWKEGGTGTSTTITAPAVAGTYAIYVRAIGNGSGYDSAASTSSATLTVINPKSTGTLNKSTVAMDGTSTITMTIHPAKSTFDHVVVWHSANWQLPGNVFTHEVGLTTSSTLTVPLAWNNAYPNSKTSNGTAHVRIETYDGATKVGESSYTFTVTIPLSIVPTIGSFTDAIVPAGGLNRYIQNRSNVKLTIAGDAGAYGSTIVSRSITGMGYTASTATATFGALPIAGTFAFSGKVTDSRGRTATKILSITVYAYRMPSVKNASAYRCDVNSLPDTSGEYIRVIASSDIAPIDGQNSFALEARVYLKGGSGGNYTLLTSGVAKRFGGSYSLQKSYIVEIRIMDYFNLYSYFVEIPTGLVLLHGVDKLKGAGIGKYCENNGYLDVAWPIKSQGHDVVTSNLNLSNLLHNWDFRNPVNQRGVSGVVSGGGYFIDRWLKTNENNISISASGLTFSLNAGMEQRFEGHWLSGKTATISFDVDGTVHSVIGQFPSSVGSNLFYDVGFAIFEIKFGYGNDYMYVNLTSLKSLSLVRLKLELDNLSTLAYDAPMDYGAELAKCKYYYERVEFWKSAKSTKSFYDSTVQWAEKRIIPTHSISVAQRYDNNIAFVANHYLSLYSKTKFGGLVWTRDYDLFAGDWSYNFTVYVTADL